MKFIKDVREMMLRIWAMVTKLGTIFDVGSSSSARNFFFIRAAVSFKTLSRCGRIS